MIMNNVELSAIGAAVRNEKRVIILQKLVESGSLSWSEIVAELETHLKGKINPNTVSFHLKFLLDRKIVIRKGDRYSLNEGDDVKRRISALIS